MSSTVCEYEQQRMQRIHDNQIRLGQLGVKQAASAMEASTKTVKIAARYCDPYRQARVVVQSRE